MGIFYSNTTAYEHDYNPKETTVTRLASGIRVGFGGQASITVSADAWRDVFNKIADLISAEEVTELDKLTEEGEY